MNIIRLLLDRGADPNLAFQDGRSALEHAIIAERPDIVRLLVQRGAVFSPLDPQDRFYRAKSALQIGLHEQMQPMLRDSQD